MRRDDSEIIEVFDADDAVFATVADTAVVAGPDVEESMSRRPRWVVPGGVAALLAVVTVVATTGADDSSRAGQDIATTTSASTPVTLAALPTSTDDGGVEVMPRYAITLPPDYAVAFATSGEQTQYPIRSQLWATPGSAQNVGRWAAISARPSEADDSSLLSLQSWSYPVLVGGSPGIVTVPAIAGGTTFVALYRSDLTVFVEGFGVSADFLLAAAGSAVLGPAPTFELTSNIGIFDEFRLVVDSPLYWRTEARDGPQAQVYARRAEASGWTQTQGITVRTARPSPQYTDVLPFVFGSLTTFRAPDGSIGLAGVEATFPGQPSNWQRATAYWVDPAGWGVAVTATGSISEVIALAQAAYRTEATEWATFEDAFISTSSQVLPTVITAMPITLDTGDAQAGDGNKGATGTVLARLQSSTLGGDSRYGWTIEIDDPNSPTNGERTETDAVAGDVASVQVLSSTSNAFVFAIAPREVAGGAILTVHFADGSSTQVPLTDIEPAFGVLGAAVTFDRPGAFSAVVTAADGTVLTSWQTSVAG